MTKAACTVGPWYLSALHPLAACKLGRQGGRNPRTNMHSPGRGIHGQLSSARFEAVFSVFSTGAACLPAAGLGAVPEQTARVA